MKRWLILLLGMIANLAQGVAYASSVLRDPMMAGLLGITDPVAGKACFSTIFTLSILFVPLGMLLAGRLEKISHRLPIVLGAAMYGLGVFASGFATNFYVLCLTFGFMLSFGSGLAYGSIVAHAVRWFPDKKGLASGLVVGALGFGPVWIAPLCASLLADQFTIQQVLQILGVICLAAIGLAVLIPSAPQQQGEAAIHLENKSNDLMWTQMIQTRKFWTLFILFLLGTAPGIMIISAASGIFQSLGGLTPQNAAGLVAVLAMANALGRFLWGTISDYVGRINALTAMYFLSVLAMIALTLPAASHSAVLITIIFVIGATYGGYLGLFPSLCVESFGLKNMVVNYALLFIAFSIAALVGSKVYVAFDLHSAFYVAAGLALTGCILSLLYRKINPANTNENKM